MPRQKFKSFINKHSRTMYGGASMRAASTYSEGTSVPSTGLSRLASARRVEAATSQGPGAPMHVSPSSLKKAGKIPTFTSMSNVSEQAIQCAVHNASRGAFISPTIMKSAGSSKAQHHEVFQHASYQGGANVYAPQPQVPQAVKTNQANALLVTH